MIQPEFMNSHSLLQFGIKSPKIPSYNCQSRFHNDGDLASLENSQETAGPSPHPPPPTFLLPNDIRHFLNWNVSRQELIRENVFQTKEDLGHLPACLPRCLCVVAEEQYNIAYFFVKRIECARANPTANLPYGMFLTCLYRHIMEAYSHLDNGIYDIVDRVMRPLSLK
ncbi:hypothetical protein Tco_0424884 [Tanacetum coccineum]